MELRDALQAAQKRFEDEKGFWSSANRTSLDRAIAAKGLLAEERRKRQASIPHVVGPHVIMSHAYMEARKPTRHCLTRLKMMQRHAMALASTELAKLML